MKDPKTRHFCNCPDNNPFCKTCHAEEFARNERLIRDEARFAEEDARLAEDEATISDYDRPAKVKRLPR